MQGIDSEGFDASCSTDRATGAEALKQSLVGTAGLTANDIFLASWSGNYCDAGKRFQPKYEKSDTCVGAQQGALYVSALIIRTLTENPNTHFTIIGHSLGGLAVAYWASAQATDFLKTHVDGVITLDSMVYDGQPTEPSIVSWIVGHDTACSLETSQSWKDIRGEGTVVPSINNYDRTTRVAPFSEVNVRNGVGPITVGDVLPGEWRDIELGCGDHGCVWTDSRSQQFVRDAVSTARIDDRDSRIVRGAGWGTSENSGYIGGRVLTTTAGGATLSTNYVGEKLTVVYKYDNPLAAGSSEVEAQVRVDGGVWQALPSLCDSTYSIGHPYGYRESTKLDSLWPSQEHNLCAVDLASGGGTHTFELQTACPLGCSGGSAFRFDALEVNALPASFNSNPVDVAFVIDTTGSMSDDIAAAKASAVSIVNNLKGKEPDTRIALVDFRDFPVLPYGNPWSDYEYKDQLGFTSDGAAAVSAINGLTIGDGQDAPEDDYCALMHAIENATCHGTGVGSGIGAWRSIPGKYIILMTDSTTHDPEPFTGYTGAMVATAAKNADPITIEMIGIGGWVDPALASMVADTGGQVFPAATADDVVKAIEDAITVITTPTDTTPPVTTASLDPAAPDGARGWYKSDVTVTLSASDPPNADDSAGSGVADTQYQVNGGGWQTYSGPFIVSNESLDNVVEFYSTDVAGNVEATQSVHFKLDKTPPGVAIGVGTIDGIVWDQAHLEHGILTNESSLHIDCTASDNLALFDVHAVDVDAGTTIASQSLDQSPPLTSSPCALDVPLHAGINTIDLLAEDGAGWTHGPRIEVVYVTPLPCPRPKDDDEHDRGRCVRNAEFWREAVKHHSYTDAQMEAMLDEINVVSDVWGNDPSRNRYGPLTLDNYRSFLKEDDDHSSAEQRLQGLMLADWLNLVSGRLTVKHPVNVHEVERWKLVMDDIGNNPRTYALKVMLDIEAKTQPATPARKITDAAIKLARLLNLGDD